MMPCFNCLFLLLASLFPFLQFSHNPFLAEEHFTFCHRGIIRHWKNINCLNRLCCIILKLLHAFHFGKCAIHICPVNNMLQGNMLFWLLCLFPLFIFLATFSHFTFLLFLSIF